MKTLISLIVSIFLMFALSSVASSQSGDTDLAKLHGEMNALIAKQDYKRALTTARRIVELTVQQYGKGDLRTARAMAYEGLLEKASGDVKLAADSLDEAADIFEKQKDLDKVDGANLASVLEALGGIRDGQQNVSAIGLFKKALEWREKSNGPDAPETAYALAYLGNYSFWERDYKRAANYYSRALTNLAKSKKATKDDITLIYYRTQCTYRKAKIEDQFDSLRQLYSPAAEFRVVSSDHGPDARQAMLIHGGVVNGKALDLAKPSYPAEARQARAEGTVEVDVLINERGQVISACAVDNKAHPALSQASEGAALKSKFSPTTLEGNPVKVSGRIIYNFRR